MATSKTTSGIVRRKVTLIGTADIMFDRYPGDNKTLLPPAEMMYFAPGTRQLVLPAVNIVSFLGAINTPSCARRFAGSKESKALGMDLTACVAVDPMLIPILRDGKPIEFSGFDAMGVDKQARMYVHHAVARVGKGIPNPKHRPTLELPWSLEFMLSIFAYQQINEAFVRGYFDRGGALIGLGTFRGVYGKFRVGAWETCEEE